MVNLGSPDSPAAPDVRRFLNEFLMDERVLDMPYLIRRCVVSCFILPARPKKSAHAYQSIWWDEGAPLVVISQKLQQKLQAKLDAPLALAMRYGNPSIESGLKNLLAQGVDRIFLIPLYPHYAMPTYETVVAATQKALAKLNDSVPLEILPPYFNNPLYIEALVASAKEPLDWDYDHLLFSYHGIPERHLKKTDPTGGHCLVSDACCDTPSAAHATCYRYQTRETTALFVQQASIPRGKYSIAYQSRFGRDAWLQPFTDEEIVRLARSGVRNLLVICPAFASDCLETLEEIGIRGQKAFLEAGGEELRLTPCLNDHPVWVEALRRLCSP